MTSEHSQPDIELMSDIVHELKAPLIAVRGFLELVSHLGPLNDSQTTWVNRSYGALDRMEKLITNLLDFARLEAGGELELEDVDLLPMIREAITLLEETAAERNISLRLEQTTESLVVNGDSTLLSQVIYNLLVNAIKYNNDGGKVIIKTRHQGPLARVDVKDTGVGVKEDELERIFERFYRAHVDRAGDKPIQRGTGLGLAIARTVIERHGGDIWATSDLGKGSTFTFTLPINGPPHRPTELSSNYRRYERSTAQAAIEPEDAVDDDAQESADAIESESRKDTP